MDTADEDKKNAAEIPESTPFVTSRSPTDNGSNHAAFLFSRKFGLALAVLVGAAITASTTYALVERVQHLIASASVTSDPAVWIRAARTQGYDGCYLGCTKCDDPSYAYKACAKTAQVKISGVTCDGNLMWNWKERYPTACLKALGEVFKKEALDAKKDSYKKQYAIVILTVLGGLVGGFVVYKLWRWATTKAKNKAEQSQQWSRAAPEAEPNNGENEQDAKSQNGTSTHSSKSRKGPKFIIMSFLALFTRAPGARAYSCTGYDATNQQYFTNANKTVYGVVNGWYSNCYDVQHCKKKCKSKCNDNGCKKTCKDVCHTKTYSNKAPEDYVQEIMSSVRACGFKEADRVSGDFDVRVANAGIEQNWWVQMKVNGYNVTNANDTDESIWCLHDIGN